MIGKLHTLRSTWSNKSVTNFYQRMASSAPPAVPEYAPNPILGQTELTPQNSPDINLIQFQNKYEVNPKYLQSMSKLAAYDTVLICDDSGSMRDLADPDISSQFTRWDELKKSVSIIIEAHAVVGTTCDIYFINRGSCRGISSYDQVAHIFAQPPHGGTNIVNVLNMMANDHIGADMGKSLIVHILTDGHPTNAYGQEDIAGLTSWLRNRKFINKTFYSIILCTDDEEIEKSYRVLEYNPRYNRGVQGVDVTEDYRGETRDVKRARGQSYRFTFGDYIVKTVIGAIDPSVHLIDLPEPCCIIL